jgi:hypothetical protein
MEEAVGQKKSGRSIKKKAQPEESSLEEMEQKQSASSSSSSSSSSSAVVDVTEQSEEPIQEQETKKEEINFEFSDNDETGNGEPITGKFVRKAAPEEAEIFFAKAIQSRNCDFSYKEYCDATEHAMTDPMRLIEICRNPRVGSVVKFKPGFPEKEEAMIIVCYRHYQLIVYEESSNRLDLTQEYPEKKYYSFTGTITSLRNT